MVWVKRVTAGAVTLAMSFGVAAVAPQQAPKTAKVILVGDLLDNLLRATFPLSVPSSVASQLGEQELSVTDAVFCGVTRAGAGRFVAAAKANDDKLPPAEPRLSKDDCRTDLEVAASRLCRTGHSEFVFNVEMTWKDFSILIAAPDAARGISGQDCKATKQPVSSKEFLRIPTGPLTGKVGTEQVKYYFALSFSDSAALVTAVLDEDLDGFESDAKPIMSLPKATSPTNFQLTISEALVNRIVPGMLAYRPPTLKTGAGPPDFPAEIVLARAQLVSEHGRLRIEGRAVTDNSGDYSVSVGLSGDDLAVASIALEYQREDCHQPNVLKQAECRGRNELRADAARLAAAAFSNAYKGQKVRPFSTLDSLPVSVNDQRVNLTAMANKVSYKESAIQILGFLAVETNK